MNRIPYGITFHPSWWHKNAGIDFSQPFFDDYAYRVDCDVRMRRTLYDFFGRYGIGEKNPVPRPLLGTDYLAAGYLYSELLGCSIVYQSDNSPQVVCAEIDIDQVRQIRVPDLDKSPIWARMQCQIDAMLSRYGHVEPYINMQGIQNIALDLMGQEVFTSYYTDPEEVRELLGKITELTIAVGRRLYALSDDISGGVTGIVSQVMPKCYLTSNCSVEMTSNGLYEEFLLPFDIRLAEEFTNFGIHHCGRSMEHVAEGYAKVPNVTFGEVGAGSNIPCVRERLPDWHLNLRYSAVDIRNETPAEIHARVREMLAQGRADQGKISISCVGMDANTPPDNILAFLDACAEANRR